MSEVKGFGTIGSLGQLPFVCSYEKMQTFKDLSLSRSVKWTQHDVYLKKPVVEYVGEELDSGELTIRFDASLGVEPKKGLERLKKMMLNKQYKTLIIGGEIIGRFVITGIDEERKFHDGKGRCIIAEATVKLIEWSK